MLLEKLCNANGVSGDEKRIRQIIEDQIKPYADEIIKDTMGNLYALKKGKINKTVMISAHMDEVGFIVKNITKEGYLEFSCVGGIDTRVIISKRVKIGEGEVPGVIGIKAIHLTKKSERENAPKLEDLYIDIGAKDKEDALKYVNLGDFVSFDTKFEYLGKDTIKAKAIDDRVGCYILINLIKKEVLCDTWFCFFVQEEVGLRGARVGANKINPDISLVVEATTCSDTNNTQEHLMCTKMGDGVCVTFMDRSTIVPADYYKWLYDLAKKNNISVQYKQMVSGGNDAGAIHQSLDGIKTASLSVPCRYIHSPVSICSKKDIDATYKLCEKFLENICEII